MEDVLGVEPQAISLLDAAWRIEGINTLAEVHRFNCQINLLLGDQQQHGLSAIKGLDHFFKGSEYNCPPSRERPFPSTRSKTKRRLEEWPFLGE
jgi:hypothetical protein